MKIKIISPVLFKKIRFYKILGYTFLIFESLTSNFFFKLFGNMQIAKFSTYFLFSFTKFSLYTTINIRNLYYHFRSLEQNKQRSFYKKLLLKGLGFKIISFIQNEFIELKIGFSHNVKIKIPKKSNLNIYINKNMIVIEGFLKYKVGNFANKIKSFRLPDSYKGKGIWYKKEVKFLKEIKKT